MMIKPFSISGRVEEDFIESDKFKIENLRYYIVDSLREEGAGELSYVGENICFRVGFFSVMWNWRPLSIVSSGELKVQKFNGKAMVLYVCHYGTHAAIAFAIISAIALFEINKILRDKDFLYTLVALWTFLVYGNILIDRYRFPRFIRKLINEANKVTYF